MNKDKKARVSDVYGVSRDIPLNYVERESVDNRFISDLSVDKHIIVYGSSKQGKTCLRRHCLKIEDYILVQCQNGWGLEKLAEGILKESGYQVKVSNERTVENKSKLIAKFSSTLNAIGLGGASASLGSESERLDSGTEKFESLLLDPSDPNDLVAALSAVNFSKFIVLEDFHYLPRETQESFAFFLKTIHEKSKLCCVIVAVWREENRLILFNGDLSGRVVSVDADAWSHTELRCVVQKGAQILNLEFSDSFIDDAITACLGSVYILQEVFRRVCEEAGIVGALDNRKEVAPKKEAFEYAREVVNESGPRYRAFLTSFSEGFQETELQMYRWLLDPILSASAEDLENGLSYRVIRERLEQVHPRKAALNAGNVSQALVSVPGLQSKKNVRPFIFDYDQANKKLTVVDRGFLIWLSMQDRKELKKDLEVNSS